MLQFCQIIKRPKEHDDPETLTEDVLSHAHAEIKKKHSSTIDYYVLLYANGAFLDSELVMNGWLSRQELIDSIAIGQFTPGPVLSTATFIGWQINGFYGAIAATVGIFLPSFIFVAILNPLIPKMRKVKIITVFLDSINIAAVAVILGVSFEMIKETIIDWRMMLIAIISIVFVFLFKKINSALIVLGGGVLGYLLTYVNLEIFF